MTHSPLGLPSASTSTFGPRERLVDVGIDALSDAELIALLLGTGTAAESVGVLAQRLLEEHGGLVGLGRAGAGELAIRRGIGAAKGARIAAAVELGRRVGIAEEAHATLRLPDGAAVAAWARPRLGALDHEELWLLALDGNNHLRAARRVAKGGLHGMYVSARDPLRFALREGASAFVLVHNHPSGDSTPSTEDVQFTLALAAAGRVVSTPLLDHVVVARDGYASMLSLGLIPNALD